MGHLLLTVTLSGWSGPVPDPLEVCPPISSAVAAKGSRAWQFQQSFLVSEHSKEVGRDILLLSIIINGCSYRSSPNSIKDQPSGGLERLLCLPQVIWKVQSLDIRFWNFS